MQNFLTNIAVSVPIKTILIDYGIAKASRDLIKSLDIGQKLLVVSDENTSTILGNNISKSINAESFIFPVSVKADYDNVKKLQEKLQNYDAIIAVGSGTINDICKYASFLSGKPYVVFPTALSMNGYTSANASITIAGHKKSLKAHLPSAIFIDLDIVSKAPIRLTRSGLGDSICRSTSQSDWLLSHHLLGTKYSALPFDLLKNYERDLFDNSKNLVNGDAEISALLAKTLIISGIGMYISDGSYPASQGEHMVAHTIDMVYQNHAYHGEQIGITTLTMARLQEALLEKDHIATTSEYIESEILKFFGYDLGHECLKEYNEKLSATPKTISQKQWLAARDAIMKIKLPVTYIEKTLINAGAHIIPDNIGLPLEDYEKAMHFAKYTRNRFTFLDIK